MAQTTAGLSSKDFTIWTSPDGSVWTDRSGYGTRIQPAQATRRTGQTNTFDGDIAFIVAGKRPAQNFHGELVYTEEAAGFFEVLRAAYEAGSDFYIRFAPKGGQTGEFMFTSSAGKVTALDYPQGDANSGDPVILGFDVFLANFVKSIAP